ncbi:MAG: hypothetical protein M0008_08195 [Actinomycetota bacterium]|nr:hypothetical protein [Actinomycetota bacterium]
MLKSPRTRFITAVVAIAVVGGGGLAAALVVPGPSAASPRLTTARHLRRAATIPSYHVPRVASTPVPPGTPPWITPCYKDSAAVPLKPCLAGGAARERQTQSQLLASPSGSEISEQQALLIAGGSRSANKHRPPEYAKLTTYLRAENLMGEPTPSNPYINPTTPVWIVTVIATVPLWSHPAPLSPAQKYPPVTSYTVILDAFNGQAVDLCEGCHSVGP